MLGFWLGCYYGCVLGFLCAISYRHWESLYEPRAYIHEEPPVHNVFAANTTIGVNGMPHWPTDGGP